MRSFFQIPLKLDVEPLRAELQSNPNLYDEIPFRREGYANPHAEMRDIWVRYNDYRSFVDANDWTGFHDPHDAIWYPSALRLPSLQPLIWRLMWTVRGERLGGVLITKTPPGGRIARHTDETWHAKYYSKFYIPVENHPGACFCFDDGVIEPEAPGEVWFFNNQTPHWVVNDSPFDRVALIVCIKPSSLQ